MRLALTMAALTLLSGMCLCREDPAGVVVFDTESAATQMISSPSLGNFALDANGPQQFTIDTTLQKSAVSSQKSGVGSSFRLAEFIKKSVSLLSRAGRVVQRAGIEIVRC
jgi:hypothetical protein